jgi:hypothetical protein
MQRRRFKNILTFPERLDQEAKRFRAEAEKLPPGSERDELLRKARQAETARQRVAYITRIEVAGITRCVQNRTFAAERNLRRLRF